MVVMVLFPSLWQIILFLAGMSIGRFHWIFMQDITRMADESR
jgi:hypothetical protein